MTGVQTWVRAMEQRDTFTEAIANGQRPEAGMGPNPRSNEEGRSRDGMWTRPIATRVAATTLED